MTTTTTAGPSLAELLRGIQRYARIDAESGGHRLGRWTREQTGRRDHRSSSARCKLCAGLAYAHVGPDGYNGRNGPAVLMRCPARPENRCEMTGVEPVRRDDAGTVVTCTLPYLTVWSYRNSTGQDAGTLRACVNHSRTYRAIAARVASFGWHQTRGPVDY